MMKRIAALMFIFFCTSVAWIILGATIFARTYGGLSDELKSRVAASWGTAQEQAPPSAGYQREVVRTVQDGQVTKQIKATEAVPFSLDASKIDVGLDLTYRQKGLLWYSTYVAVFGGDFRFTNSSGQDQDTTFRLHFPSQQAIL